MPTLEVYVGEDQVLPAGAALGFYGDDGWNDPIGLGEFNGRTFVTDPGGASENFECNNCKLLATGSWSGVGGASGVILGQVGSGLLLDEVPNYLATLNVRFTHGQNCSVQNAVFFAYDGSNPDNGPSGLGVFCAEIMHTGEVQDNTGLGDDVWRRVNGRINAIDLIDSPGTSGLRPDGPLTIDTRHDWYVAMSVSPTRPGNKGFSFCFECEYA